MTPNCELVYVGEGYYKASSTILGVLYNTNTGERWDWGWVQVALTRGESVVIRPATDQELQKMDRLLKLVLKDQPTSRLSR